MNEMNETTTTTTTATNTNDYDDDDDNLINLTSIEHVQLYQEHIKTNILKYKNSVMSSHTLLKYLLIIFLCMVTLYGIYVSEADHSIDDAIQVIKDEILDFMSNYILNFIKKLEQLNYINLQRYYWGHFNDELKPKNDVYFYHLLQATIGTTGNYLVSSILIKYNDIIQGCGTVNILQSGGLHSHLASNPSVTLNPSAVTLIDNYTTAIINKSANEYCVNYYNLAINQDGLANYSDHLYYDCNNFINQIDLNHINYPNILSKTHEISALNTVGFSLITPIRVQQAEQAKYDLLITNISLETINSILKLIKLSQYGDTKALLMRKNGELIGSSHGNVTKIVFDKQQAIMANKIDDIDLANTVNFLLHYGLNNINQTEQIMRAYEDPLTFVVRINKFYNITLDLDWILVVIVPVDDYYAKGTFTIYVIISIYYSCFMYFN